MQKDHKMGYDFNVYITQKALCLKLNRIRNRECRYAMGFRLNYNDLHIV